jgi:hypothetical protein
VVSQSRNIVSAAFPGATGVSFKMRKRRETGKDSASGGQRRRAARLDQSFPCFALHGYSREALRPPVPPPVGPHPSSKAEHRAATSSFLYFERDPRGPDIHSWVGIGTAHGAWYKEKQSMRYDFQPCTVYLGPCTACGAAPGDYEANGAVQMALDETVCGLEQHPRGAPAQLGLAAEVGPCKTRKQDISGTGQQGKRTSEQRAQEGPSSPCALRGAENPKNSRRSL